MTRKPYDKETGIELQARKAQGESAAARLEKVQARLEREVNARQAAEVALQETRRRLTTLMTNLPGMVYRSKADERFSMEFVSDGCRRLTGYAPEQLIDNPNLCYKDLVDEERYAIGWQQVKKALAAGQPFQLDYRLNTASGEEKWVWEQGVGVYSRDGQLLAVEGFITDFTAYKRSQQALKIENRRLKSSIRERYRFGDIIGKSEPMQKVYDLILKAAASVANVILLGESGTGKELVARAIHSQGVRAGRAFVTVNCAAIPEGLVESEFFGHRRGAFTGAHDHKAGYLHHADGGTLFLDEVGDIGLGMQAKLLRVLENGEYTPLGANAVRTTDVRIIAATNRNLLEMVQQRLIRLDFFYRIGVIPITLPPLRQRKEDIPILVEHFLRRYSPNDPSVPLPGNLMDDFLRYPWPGNVRELQNALQRYLTVDSSDFLEFGPSMVSDPNQLPAMLPPVTEVSGPGIRTYLLAVEKNLLLKTLQGVGWNRQQAAELLGISRRSLFRRMQRTGLKRP